MQMKTIKLTKVKKTELSVLWGHIQFYNDVVIPSKNKSDIDKLLNSIIEVDISLKLWYMLRTKIEKNIPVNGTTLNLKLSEAAILFIILREENQYLSEHWLNIIRKYRNEIDRQLKSIVWHSPIA